MGTLFQLVQELVESDRYLIGEHASERILERGFLEWQVVAGVKEATLLEERPSAVPNPTVELEELLPDGTSFKAVWAILPRSHVAKLVTVHFFDD